MPAVCGVNNHTPATIAASATNANFFVAVSVAFAKFSAGLAQEVAAFNGWAAQQCPGACPVKAPANPQPAFSGSYMRVVPAPGGKVTVSFGVAMRGSFRCSKPAGVAAKGGKRGGRGGRQTTVAQTRSRGGRSARG
jgi:hypothetical protein